MHTFKAGDRVVITAGKAQTKARVSLASANGASLVVTFEGGFSPGGAGAFVGMMPLLRQADGTFAPLMGGGTVTVEPEEGPGHFPAGQEVRS